MAGWVELLDMTGRFTKGDWEPYYSNGEFQRAEGIAAKIGPGQVLDICAMVNHARRTESPDSDRNQQLRVARVIDAQLLAGAKHMLYTAAKLLDSYDAQWSGNYTPDIYDNARYAELVALVMPFVDFRHPSAPGRAKIAARAWGESGVELPKQA